MATVGAQGGVGLRRFEARRFGCSCCLGLRGRDVAVGGSAVLEFRSGCCGGGCVSAGLGGSEMQVAAVCIVHCKGRYPLFGQFCPCSSCMKH